MKIKSLFSKIKNIIKNKKIKDVFRSIEARISVKKTCYALIATVLIVSGVIMLNVLINSVKTHKEYNRMMHSIDNYVNKEEYDKALSKTNYGLKKFKGIEKYILNLKDKKAGVKKLKENYDYDTCLKVAESESVEITDDERIDAYTRAIDIKPSEEELYISAASIFVQYNDYDKAVNLLSSGVDACENIDNKEAKSTAINLTKKIDEINELMFNNEYNSMYLEAKTAYEEGDFDKVILKYNQCLLKNRNDARLYVIMAKAYFDENRYTEAIKTLNEGINRLKTLGADKKTSKQYANYGYLVKLRNSYKKIQKVSNEYDAFYKNLLIACKVLKEENKLDKVKKIILKYDFKTISGCNKITYYTDKGMYVQKLNSGMGIAVYSNGYIYYGEWKNGKKSGDGYLIAISKKEENLETYMYQGVWNNDYPNGKGKIVYENYKGDILNYKAVTEGNFENGYENGKMKITKKGSSIEGGELSMKYVAVKGEPVVVKEKGEVKKSADGSFVIGYYYDKHNIKREVSSIPDNGNGPKKVYWRVNGLNY